MTCLLARDRCSDRINTLVNDPAIYPYVRGDHVGTFDLTAIAENENNVVLCGDNGGVFFVKHGTGYYEAHTAVLPSGRGRWTLEMGNEALWWMFTKTDAIEILTKCPHNNLAAIAGARAIGAKMAWTTRPLWPSDDGLVPWDVYVITINDWTERHKNRLEREGERFHHWLEQFGVETDHGDDPVHNVYVGGAVAMIEAGQLIKGIGYYNRWAVMSDYRPISLVQNDPPILDIGSAKIVRISGEWGVA